MLFGFIVIIAAGHFYCSMIVLVVATGAFKEILDLKRNREKETQIPVSSFLNWYFFAVAIFYFYIPQITNKVPSFTLKNNFLAVKISTTCPNCLANIEVPQLHFLLTLDFGLFDLRPIIEKGILSLPIPKIWLDPHDLLLHHRSYLWCHLKYLFRPYLVKIFFQIFQEL